MTASRRSVSLRCWSGRPWTTRSSRWIRKDGSRFWASVTITRVRDENGRLTGFAKVTRDLTERRRHEQTLRKAVEDLRRANEELDRFASIAADDMTDPLPLVGSHVEWLDGRVHECTERGLDPGGAVGDGGMHVGLAPRGAQDGGAALFGGLVEVRRAPRKPAASTRCSRSRCPRTPPRRCTSTTPRTRGLCPRGLRHGPRRRRQLWVLTPGDFEALVEEGSLPAAAPTLPPADLLPPDDIADIVRRHGNKLLI